MRKVTKEVVSSFMHRQPKAVGNTTTDGDTLRLHGNAIARWTETGQLEVSFAGWGTVTTRDRLNGIPGVNVHQHRHDQYMDGELVEDLTDWHIVKDWKSDSYGCERLGLPV